MKQYNFKDVLANDSFGEKNLTIKNGNLPIDLTGVLIKIQFRKSVKTGVVAKTLTQSSGINIYDPTNGLFRIESFIVNFVPDIYYYDCQFTFPDGRVMTYFGGFLKVIQDVTQNT
jgi:hypothetical protein